MGGINTALAFMRFAKLETSCIEGRHVRALAAGVYTRVGARPTWAVVIIAEPDQGILSRGHKAGQVTRRRRPSRSRRSCGLRARAQAIAPRTLDKRRKSS